MNCYTGREIAIFTDCHALLEPTVAVLEDISKRGITEIYSLGDSIGVGPNPSLVLSLLKQYKVKCLSGNSEEYCILGFEPFRSYFTYIDKLSYSWTISKLNAEQLGEIKLMPHFIELMIGGKRIALCHFSNDVRCDFNEHSTWSYQLNESGDAYKQFLYTNSDEQLLEIKNMIDKYGKDSPFVRGYISAMNDPLFFSDGLRRSVDFYDAVIQGHVHFKMYEETDKTKFYSIRAVGMAYGTDPVDTASYIILREKLDGFDLEEVLVKYDREKMISSILSSTCPDDKIKKYTNIKR